MRRWEGSVPLSTAVPVALSGFAPACGLLTWVNSYFNIPSDIYTYNNIPFGVSSCSRVLLYIYLCHAWSITKNKRKRMKGEKEAINIMGSTKKGQERILVGTNMPRDITDRERILIGSDRRYCDLTRNDTEFSLLWESAIWGFGLMSSLRWNLYFISFYIPSNDRQLFLLSPVL